MKETRITLPELALLAGTRAVLGAGLGLLAADWLTADQRKALGWGLLSIGVLSTIPLAFEVLGRDSLSTVGAWQNSSDDALSVAHDRLMAR
jgi:hypothetical protein